MCRPPVLVMVKVLASGLALSCVAAKETLVELAPIPEVGLSTNHAAWSLALQPHVPPPVLLMGAMCRTCGGGWSRGFFGSTASSTI